jgi:long-chain fatty acid transport protein
MKVAVNNIDPRDGDGQLELKDEDWTVQYNLGVLYEPTKGTRLGLTYLSEADLDFEDRVEFSGLGQGLEDILTRRGLIDAKLDLGMTMPQAVMFSVYHEVTDRLALMANLGWQDWSEFGKVDVSVAAEDSNSLTADLDYDDTWHAALGAQYRVSEPLLLTAGIAYDSAMMDEDQLTPALPVGETWRFGLGTRYNWSQDVTLGAAYELAWGGDLDMDVERGPLAGRVSGTYESVAIHFVCLNAEWRF